MTIVDIQEIMTKCKVEMKCEISDERTLGEIGLDSLDVMMFTFEVNKLTGKQLVISPNDTVADLLSRANG